MAPRWDFFLGEAAVVVAMLSAGAWEGASAAATGMPYKNGEELAR